MSDEEFVNVGVIGHVGSFSAGGLCSGPGILSGEVAAVLSPALAMEMEGRRYMMPGTFGVPYGNSYLVGLTAKQYWVGMQYMPICSYRKHPKNRLPRGCRSADLTPSNIFKDHQWHLCKDGTRRFLKRKP